MRILLKTSSFLFCILCGQGVLAHFYFTSLTFSMTVFSFFRVVSILLNTASVLCNKMNNSIASLRSACLWQHRIVPEDWSTQKLLLDLTFRRHGRDNKYHRAETTLYTRGAPCNNCCLIWLAGDKHGGGEMNTTEQKLYFAQEAHCAVTALINKYHRAEIKLK